MSRRRDERGQTTLLIVGFAMVLIVAIGVVTNASAAFLRRQALDSLAEGAALAAADAASGSSDVYEEGIDGERLSLDPALAEAAVAGYLSASGGRADFPGLSASTTVVDGGTGVVVEVRAPISLPFRIPGGPGGAVVAARGSAVVTTDD